MEDILINDDLMSDDDEQNFKKPIYHILPITLDAEI